MSLARASASSFSAFNNVTRHRGLRCSLQVCLTKSSISSAVVLGSILTVLSSGAGGAFTSDHSLMMVWAGADTADTKIAVTATTDSKACKRNTVSSQQSCSRQGHQKRPAQSTCSREAVRMPPMPSSNDVTEYPEVSGLSERVKSGHGAIKLRCPLYPRKRTFARAIRMSALGQKQTSACSFDQVVGNGEYARWNREPERLSGR